MKVSVVEKPIEILFILNKRAVKENFVFLNHWNYRFL